jgi:hypothetical protein
VSQLYPYARELFATGQLSWLAGVYRAILLPDAYLPDFTNQYLISIPLGTRVATSFDITGRTATNGICGGNPIEFPLLADDRFVSQAIIYKHTTVEATSILVAYIDRDTLVTTPFKPVGIKYYIYPNTEEGGFFRI